MVTTRTATAPARLRPGLPYRRSCRRSYRSPDGRVDPRGRFPAKRRDAVNIQAIAVWNPSRTVKPLKFRDLLSSQAPGEGDSNPDHGVEEWDGRRHLRRTDDHGLRDPGVGREGGGAAVSAVNAVGLVVARRPGRSSWSRPCCSRSGSDEHHGLAGSSSSRPCSSPWPWCYRPLGDYMDRVVHRRPSTPRVERGIYRLVGVDPDAEQRWRVYARSVLAFSAVSDPVPVRVPAAAGHLPLSLGLRPSTPAWPGTPRVSFVTNTNWQAYSGESTMGHLVQMAGLAVQNFVSAAVGIAVASPWSAGFARTQDRPARQLLGRPGPDHAADPAADRVRRARSCWCAAGVVQNFSGRHRCHHADRRRASTFTGGPVASQEAIKELGTNGGGFYNVNSAHPFENPTALDQLAGDLPAAGDPVQPAAHVRPDGRRQPPGLRDRRGDGDHRDRLASA